MSNALPLFYQQPAPLDAQQHQGLSLKTNFGFEFTRGVNAVPVNLIEMPQVCHSYPIAFSPDGNATPVAILGLRDGENLFLKSDGSWAREGYIPAYIRRYPFIFSELPDSEQLALCIDLDESVVETGGEQRFFDEDGKPSELSNNALEFCKSYHAAAQQTLDFSHFLTKSDLLVTREAQINVSKQTRINFSGFKVIDEKRFAELPAEQFLHMRKKGWLPFVYAHLFSGTAWQQLSAMLQKRLPQEEATDDTAQRDVAVEQSDNGYSQSTDADTNDAPITLAFAQFNKRFER